MSRCLPWIRSAVLLAGCLSAGTAAAGGQGSFADSAYRLLEFMRYRDDREVAARLLAPEDGSPVPRMARIGAPDQACVDPALRPVPFEEADYSCSSAQDPGCACTDEAGCFPASYLFPFQEPDLAPCAPVFIPEAELEATVRVFTDRDALEDPIASLGIYSVALRFDLDVETLDGAAAGTLASVRLPGSGRHVFSKDLDSNQFLSPPLLIDEITWFDGTSFPCDAEAHTLDQRYRPVEIERVMNGALDDDGYQFRFPDFPRAEAIAFGQQHLPQLLCEPDGAGNCAFTPALVAIEPDGALTGLEETPGTQAGTACRFRLRFAEPVTACNDGADDDGDGATDLGRDPACRSLRWDDETTPLAGPAPLVEGHEYFSAAHGDLDGDGDADVVAVSQDDDRLFWYENRMNEPTDWVRHEIAPLDGARAVDVADLDGDRQLDVVVGSFAVGTPLVWYENRLAEGRSWAVRTISSDVDGVVQVDAADLDGDGRQDVLSTAFRGEEIAWHRNRGGTGWTSNVVAAEQQGVRSAVAADLDGDGALDVLAAGAAAGGGLRKVAWYRNAGGGTGWSEQGITSTDDPRHAIAADLDGDSDPDVALALTGGDQIVWLANLGAGVAWSAAQAVGATAPGAVSLVAVDVEGDGDLDLAAAQLGEQQPVPGDYSNGRLAWYENRGAQGFRLLVSDSFPRARWVASGDLDRDGRPDLVVAGVSVPAVVPSDPPQVAASLAWQRNLAPPVIVSDPLAGALPQVTQGFVRGTLVGALPSLASACDDDTPPQAWYRFVAPRQGTVEVDTCGSENDAAQDEGVDTVLSLFAPPVTSAGLPTELDCNDDRPPDPVPAHCAAAGGGDSFLRREVAAGETLWIRVGSAPSTGPGEYWLHVQFVPEPDATALAGTAVLALGAAARWRRGC